MKNQTTVRQQIRGRIGAIGATGLVSIHFMKSASAQELAIPQSEEALEVIGHLVNWPGLVTSIFVVFVSWLVLRFITDIVNNIGEVFAERRLRFQRAIAFFKFFTYIAVAVVVVLLSFHISQQTLSLMGGAIAFALGFAAKDLVASLVAGFMIMADRPFQVGDRVSFGGQYGDVTAIGLRSVRMRTLDDSVVTIPNNLFLTDVTTCGNYGVLHMQIMLDLYIGVDQDVELAKNIVEEATTTSRFVYLPNPVEVLVSQELMANIVAIRLRMKAYVLDTKYEKAFASDVTTRVLKAFAEHGIKPPAVIQRQLKEEDDEVAAGLV